jgi:DNA-binding transcriptional regulator LsrR (DeoR family)
MAGKELMLRVLRESFQNGLSNKEIAPLLREDRWLRGEKSATRVQEILNEGVTWLLAEQERLEKIDAGRTKEIALARELCKAVGLLDARVVTGGETHTAFQYKVLVRRQAMAAASYFDAYCLQQDEMGEQVHVSLSGGQTILDMCGYLSERLRSNVHFYSAALLGRGKMNWTAHVGPETTASLAWSRSGRIPQQLFYGTVSPYKIDPHHLKDLGKDELHNWVRNEIVGQVNKLSKDPQIRDTMAEINSNVNMAVAGIGLVRATGTDKEFGPGHIERLTMTNLLKPLKIDLESLSKEKAVGELAYCLFDAQGKGNPDWNFFVTAGSGTENSGVDFYRDLVNRGKVVMVIAGARKWDALTAAISGGLFNVLVTDAYTATRLIAWANTPRTRK